MDGYLDDPKATAEAITADGWLRTGDLVRIRDDGQLVIRDRIKELIKVRGASVAPAEVELVLRRHRAVGDAAVVGSPHREYGEVPVAYVVLQESASPEELISFSAAHLAPYKLPSTVRIVDELPRMPTGKLLRAALRGRERLAAR
jgi:acyl-CoA synthetase (AMP-forming)/AMP-acid ligase II